MYKHIYTTMLIMFSIFTTNNFSFGQSKMIWSEISGKITQSNIDGSEKVQILARHIPYDVEADTTNQTIYWSETGSKSIWKYYIALDSTEKVFQSNEAIRGLTLDQNKLYFILESGINKMNLDGTQVESVWSVADANDLVLVNDKLFWTDRVNDKIWTKNAAGSGNTALFSNLNNPSTITYNQADMKLYWLEYCGASDCTGVRRGNINGSAKQVVINEFVDGFTLNATRNKVICTYDIFDEIFSVNTNGSERTTLLQIGSSPRNIAIAGNRYYWFDLSFGDYLFSNNFAGSDERVIASSPVYRPTRFVIDTTEKWIYWVNTPGSFQADKTRGINRARLDGSNIQHIIPSNELEEPFGIGLDIANQKLYWSDRSDHVIRRSNTDGTAIENVIPDDGGSPWDIVIDAANNRLFWTDTNGGKIKKSDLDGNQLTTLASGLGYPTSIAYNPVADEIFFSEYTGGKTIQKMSTSGGLRDTIAIITNPFSNVNGIWVDPTDAFLYWTDGSYNQVNRVSLDGSNSSLVLAPSYGLNIPSGIQVLPASTVVKTTQTNVEKIAVYPNPFSASFMLKNAVEGDRLTLFNMMGRTVKTQVLNAADLLQIDGSALPVGVYVLVIQHKNGQTAVQKLVKAK